MRRLVLFVFVIMIFTSCEQSKSYDYLPDDLKFIAMDASEVDSWDVTDPNSTTIIKLFQTTKNDNQLFTLDYKFDDNYYKKSSVLLSKGDSVLFYRYTGYSILLGKGSSGENEYVLYETNTDFRLKDQNAKRHREIYFDTIDELERSYKTLDTISFDASTYGDLDYQVAIKELEFIKSSI